jgi:UDP-N-acetylmuramate dehydrogenase
MSLRDQFAGIIQCEAPLAPFTHLRIGGPAEHLVTPTSREELAGVVMACTEDKVPLRVLGAGANLLVRDEGVRGAVLRLSAPCFTQIQVEGQRVLAGGGATLSAVIAETSQRGLAGFETLAGITATIGGALRHNAGDRAGEMADHMKRVEVMSERGQVRVHERSDLHFGDHRSDIEDPVVLAVEFELIKDKPEAIVKRLLRAWINRKASAPLSFQAAVRMFRNPRGYQAADLIEQAGLPKTRVGAAEISERNSNYVIAHPGTTSADVLRLLEQVQKRVRDTSGVQLERELTVW